MWRRMLVSPKHIWRYQDIVPSLDRGDNCFSTRAKYTYPYVGIGSPHTSHTRHKRVSLFSVCLNLFSSLEVFLWVVCQIKTIVVHRELFIPFKCIACSDGMTKQMRIVQIGKEQHYSLCTVDNPTS